MTAGTRRREARHVTQGFPGAIRTRGLRRAWKSNGLSGRPPEDLEGPPCRRGPTDRYQGGRYPEKPDDSPQAGREGKSASASQGAAIPIACADPRSVAAVLEGGELFDSSDLPIPMHGSTMSAFPGSGAPCGCAAAPFGAAHVRWGRALRGTGVADFEAVADGTRRVILDRGWALPGRALLLPALRSALRARRCCPRPRRKLRRVPGSLKASLAGMRQVKRTAFGVSAVRAQAAATLLAWSERGSPVE
jgi:hypothetical protein